MPNHQTPIDQLLKARFPAKHVQAAVTHFKEMVNCFQRAEWERTISKGGKLIEAVVKAIWIHVGNPLPPSRQFKVGVIATALRQLRAGSFDDTLRITLPRACEFVYDVASNRGARHDPDEIDPNEMDAAVVVHVCSWVVGEMLRYAQKGAVDTTDAVRIVAGLTERRYPMIEDVDDRVYFHVGDASARDVALLLLWRKYPSRVGRPELLATVQRHGFSKDNAFQALARLRPVVDTNQNGLRLLQPGLAEAETLLQKAGEAR